MREDCGRVGHGICLRKWVELAEMGQRREGKTSSLQFLLLLPSYLWDSHPHKTMPGIFMRKKKSPDAFLLALKNLILILLNKSK